MTEQGQLGLLTSTIAATPGLFVVNIHCALCVCFSMNDVVGVVGGCRI